MRDALSGKSEAVSVKSATRVLDLFELLGRWDAERTHTEMAEELDIPKSSLTQLLKTLSSRGYLHYNSETKSYSLGPAILTLAKKTSAAGDLVAASGPVLAWVSDATRETSALNFLKGDKSEVVAAVVGQHRLLYTMRIGDSAPLYATSGGKALLAFLPRDMRNEYLERVTLRPITPFTITSKDRLLSELEEIRETRLAFVAGEFTPGTVGMARPLLSAAGYPLAALNVVMPETRYSEEVREKCSDILAKAIEMLQVPAAS